MTRRTALICGSVFFVCWIGMSVAFMFTPQRQRPSLLDPNAILSDTDLQLGDCKEVTFKSCPGPTLETQKVPHDFLVEWRAWGNKVTWTPSPERRWPEDEPEMAP